MKKLIIVLAFMVFGMLAGAQSYTLYGKADQTYWNSATDVTITDATPVNVVIDAQVDWPTTHCKTQLGCNRLNYCIK